MGREVAVADIGPHPQTALRLLDLVQRQPAHVDQHPGPRDPELEVVHQVGAATQELGLGVSRHQRDRARGVLGAVVVELPHATPAAWRTAARMPA
jgi:hypothetical protein